MDGVTMAAEVKQIGLQYSSLASPPKGININKSYVLEICGKDVALLENGEKRKANLEFIKHYFSPTKGSWKDVI